MSEEADGYVEMHFFVAKENESAWSEDEIDSLMYEFLEFAEDRGLSCGGSMGPMKSEEMQCPHCCGSGLREEVAEEDKCDTCGGSGHKNNQDSVESWNDVYAPVAHVEESRSPKTDVESSNLSRSATNEEADAVTAKADAIVDKLFSEAYKGNNKRPLKRKEDE